ncbi:MAG: hypothetical protein FWE57_03150 [Chitinispirillia bacterium]|nr:hypothetical protein [Chitinispirillia bacterium]
MNRTARKISFCAILLVMAAATALFADRAIMERRVWYVDLDKKISEAKFWTIFLGNYDKQLTRNFPGEGSITFPASINYQLVSSGYVEGNGAGSRGPVRKLLPAMLIKVGSAEPVTISIADIDYIYDWGTKVALKDGRKGDFMINAEGKPTEIKRFAIREFREIMSHGEKVLNSAAEHDTPIIAIGFSREAAMRASREAVSD